MRIDVILLVLDEIEGLKVTVPRIPRHRFHRVFAIDGGSSDGSVEYLREQGIRVLGQSRRGRGEAFRLGVASSEADGFVFFSPDGNEDISSDIEMSDELAAFFLANSLSSAGLGDFTISSGEGDGITNIELGSVFATMERLDPEDVAAAQALQRDLIGAEAIMCEGFFGTRGGADRDRVAMRFTTTCENDDITEQSETIALDTGSLGILFILRGPPEETARVAQQLLEGALARLDDLP